VTDASRAVGVVSSLLSDTDRGPYINGIRAEYEKVREAHLKGEQTKKRITLQSARENRFKVDWKKARIKKPGFMGTKQFKAYDLGELVRYIDWTPFFQTWDLAGPFPAILTDPVVGESASNVYREAQAMLKKLIEGRWLTANGVMAILPANSVNDDDIEVYTDESKSEVAFTYYGLRQQSERPVIDGVRRPNQCLADFIAPKASGIIDYVGMFAVTAGLGIEKHEKRFEDANDDYSSIMLKALADRLAEAFAECMHARVRRDLWGYAAAETLGNDELIKEQYQGIRPAPGYPACPDHSVKRAIFELLQCQDIGMGLTDSMAMTPAASVSGFYIAHPEAKYFNVGRIGDDQVHDLAQRQGVAEKDLQRLLAPHL